MPESGICPVDYGLGFHRDPRRCLDASLAVRVNSSKVVEFLMLEC